MTVVTATQRQLELIKPRRIFQSLALVDNKCLFNYESLFYLQIYFIN